MLKASLEVLMAENTRITECRDVTALSLFDDYERFVWTTASLISVHHNVGDNRLVHTCNSLFWSIFQLQVFITAFLGYSFGNVLSIYRRILQLTVHSCTWCQRICPSTGTCGLQIYITFCLVDRGSFLNRSADMLVLWPNIPCQACLQSCTEMYFKESSIKYGCRGWFEWQASTSTLISRRLV